MSQTIIGVGDAKAVKKYSAFLAVDTPRKSYWGRKLMGDGEAASMPLQRLTELESDAGENISFDLSMQLTMQPVEGDAILENKEEALQFYSDSVYIDQMRGGVNSGGKMTRKEPFTNSEMSPESVSLSGGHGYSTSCASCMRQAPVEPTRSMYTPHPIPDLPETRSPPRTATISFLRMVRPRGKWKRPTR